jgi:hypothetical protein
MAQCKSRIRWVDAARAKEKKEIADILLMSIILPEFVKPIKSSNFNKSSVLPYGLSIKHIESAMKDFCEFINFVNTELYQKSMPTFESMMMQANFSSTVGEFMNSTIPKYCSTLAKNRYHNGHPDLVPNGRFENNSIQHSHEGIEIKASRYEKGWQGHNPESVWLMVFVFNSGRPMDVPGSIPFEFLAVYGAKLEEEDWQFAGRKEGSRRTITASVKNTGYQKMTENWIYRI